MPKNELTDEERKQFIKDIIFKGHATKTVRRFNRDWEFKTLNQPERERILSVATAGKEYAMNWTKFKSQVLKNALVSINKVEVSDDMRDYVFDSMQQKVVDALFSEYQKIDAIQLEAIDNIEQIKGLNDDFFSHVKYKVMRAIGALPTEQRCKDMNDHQWLWYYCNLNEDRMDEDKTCKHRMDYLSFFINPELAMKMRDMEESSDGKSKVPMTQAHDVVDPNNPNKVTHYGDTTLDEDFDSKIAQYMQGPLTHLDEDTKKGNMYESKEDFIARAIQGANMAAQNDDMDIIEVND